MKIHSSIALLAVAQLLLAEAVQGQATGSEVRPIEIDDYFRLQYVGNPQVSPDGEWIAYTVSGQDLGNDSRWTRIWLVSRNGGDPQPVTMQGSSAWSPRWTPDGKHLSFMASTSDGSSQVFMSDIGGGERDQLTDIDGGVEGYEWSPDGRRLVLVMRDPEEDNGPGPWVIDRLTFKADYVGYLTAGSVK